MSTNWNNDPAVQLALEDARVRRGIWISACIWMPLFLLAAGGFLFFLGDVVFDFGNGGTIFLLVVLGILAVLFGFQGFQSVLDLAGKPAEVTGWVSRRWARSDSFVMRSHYIRLDSHIFRIDRVFHADVQEGDYISVRYYPHSAVVIHVEKAPIPEGETPPPPSRARR